MLASPVLSWRGVIPLPPPPEKLLCAANNWLPLIASVLVAEIVPSATFTILRSLPADPTDTVFATDATEPAPSATLFVAAAFTVAP